ncbi:SDR family oxidoreductase [Thalassovita sp.]|uniref:SDR family oxidoreductase n=1 Tax=Thalassovita sp. TaxID=1979401 RepID=UPI0029DE884E|nr:SDR family oxidoreductase [Thalassovita sp.]
MPRDDPRLLTGPAVVTGASEGLGRALSVALTRRGVPVTGFGRRTDALAETARLAGPLFTPMTVDVSDTAAAGTAIQQIAPVLLINNAAVYPRRDILDETADSFLHSVAVNLGGVVACTRAALDGMVATGFGRIMTVSTFADIAPLPASAAYATSKGAVRIFNRALVADLGDRFPDIVINDWMPGMLATRMGIPDGLDPAISAEWGAELALWHDPGLTGTIFEQDRELPPPRSLKRRVKDRLLLRKPPPPRQLIS